MAQRRFIVLIIFQPIKITAFRIREINNIRILWRFFHAYNIQFSEALKGSNIDGKNYAVFDLPFFAPASIEWVLKPSEWAGFVLAHVKGWAVVYECLSLCQTSCPPSSRANATPFMALHSGKVPEELPLSSLSSALHGLSLPPSRLAPSIVGKLSTGAGATLHDGNFQKTIERKPSQTG